MRCVAVASVATGHAEVNVRLPQEPAYVNGRVWTTSKCSWTTWRNICSCCGLGSVRGQVRVHSGKTRVVFVLLLCIFGVELFTCRISHYPWMSVQRWFYLVRFDCSDDVVVCVDSSDDVFLVTIGTASWHSYMFGMCCCFFIHIVSLF